MTEAEWDMSHEPVPMLELCAGRNRKLRLFACACARLCSDLGNEYGCDSFWANLELCEDRAGGEMAAEEWVGRIAALESELNQFNCSSFMIAVLDTLGASAASAATSATATATVSLRWHFLPAKQTWKASLHYRGRADPQVWAEAEGKAQRHVTDRLRDIFGNPFRSVAFDPAWRTDTAVAVARQMYDSREFSAMPILADALQDAGCEDEQVLNHCRDANQVHVRGCWVCDLVLGNH